MSLPLSDLPPFHYRLVAADPPWKLEMYSAKGEAKAPQSHYDCMTTEEIAALPVGHLAAGDAVLFLWATFPMLPAAFEVIAAWGFKYKTGGAWVKRYPSGKAGFGTGYILRSACEPFLIATTGKPDYGSASERNLIDALRRQHSRKPDDAYAMLDRLVPDGPRIELFARERRPGWHAWGNQTEKFEGDTA